MLSCYRSYTGALHEASAGRLKPPVLRWRRVDTNRVLPIPRAEHSGSTPRSAIEVLLLDVGGVLAPAPDAAHVAALEGELGLAPGGLWALLHHGEPWYALSTGRLDEEGYWRAIAQQVGRDTVALRQRLLPVWEPALARLDADVVALARAAGTRVRVALLSNHTPLLEQRLGAHGIAALFHPIINSARVGLRKPDPRIFRLALDLLRLPPEAVLFVDDKPANVQAARELGMEGLCFEDAAGLRATLLRHGVVRPGDAI